MFACLFALCTHYALSSALRFAHEFNKLLEVETGPGVRIVIYSSIEINWMTKATTPTKLLDKFVNGMWNNSAQFSPSIENGNTHSSPLVSFLFLALCVPLALAHALALLFPLRIFNRMLWSWCHKWAMIELESRKQYFTSKYSPLPTKQCRDELDIKAILLVSYWYRLKIAYDTDTLNARNDMLIFLC